MSKYARAVELTADERSMIAAGLTAAVLRNICRRTGLSMLAAKSVVDAWSNRNV